MEYKGFTYTPVPKTAWDNLSMLEKSEMMKVAVRNGITDLKTIREKYNEFAEGGDIHIKDSKKGTFTAAAKKHGMGVQEFASKVLANKDDYSPAMVKKANFARNASKWKHGLGGNLFDGTSEPTQQMNIMAYHPVEDYFTGPSATMPEINVTRKRNGKTYVGLGDFSKRYDRQKEQPYFVSSRTGQLTAGDAMKGIDAATGPLLHWMQPSQYVGAFRDAVNGRNPLASMLRGNSGVVSEGYAQEHPYLSTLFNTGTDAAAYRTGAGIFNTFSKINKYRRLERNFTGVPHRQARGTSVYMDETFPKVHNKHTVWATDDADYARMFTITEDNGKKSFGTVFDVYTDPNELSILETPTVPEGQMVYWQGLPYKLNKGKVTYADNIEVRESSIPKTKEIAINNRDKYGRYDFDDTGSYIWKDGEGNGMIQDWRQVPGAISTDKVVEYSKNVGLDGTRFNKVYDGGVTLDKGVFDYGIGVYHDYPINELVLNPGAPKYVLPHGTPKYKVLNQLPNSYSANLLYNLLPLTIPTKLGHE